MFGPRGRIARGWASALLAAVAALSGCGGYARRLEDVRVSAETNRLEQALSSVDQLVARGEEGDGPQARDLPLLLLERAAIYQALGAHDRAVADLAAADAMLEVLDLGPDRVGAAAEYLWSGSRTRYRPPVYEKLMVNVMAATSYLALGDTRGAAVEARRIGVLLEYFDTTPVSGHPMLQSAAYVAGIAAELAGDDAEALRFYLRAWRMGDAPGLAAAVAELGGRGRFSTDPEVVRAREVLGLVGDAPVERAERELIVFTFSGLAPFRVAERLPIGVVFAWMRQDMQYALGETERAVYDRILAEGLLTWINYPSLVVQQNAVAPPRVFVDGAGSGASLIADVESFALAQWEAERPGIAFAAITRMITRVLAREAVQAAGSAAGGAGDTVGFLLGLATQGAMQAADTPDTRTWTLMPAYVWVTRAAVRGDRARVSVSHGAAGAAPLEVEVPAGTARVVTVRVF